MKPVRRIINKVILHCGAKKSLSTLDQIRDFHINKRNYNDIGYHWVIEPDGKVKEGRSEHIQGAHCLGHNPDSIGVCLGGMRPFPEDQLYAGFITLIHLCEKYELPYSSVYGHYEFTNLKTCPELPMEAVRAALRINLEGSNGNSSRLN